MDANWRPTQGTESTMDANDWRTQLQPDSRERVVNKIMFSTTQTGNSGGDDWQEEVYQKIKSMKESYLPELTEMHQKIAAKLQQHEALPHQPKSDQLEKLRIFKTMLERLIAFLQVSKGNIVRAFKEKMASYEKQIIKFIDTNRPRKAMSSMQLVQLAPSHIHPVSQPQSQLTQVQSRENQMNKSFTGNSGGDDWQEEVYQKIKSMKESYLPELTEMHQKIAAKLQQHEALPHQPKSDQLEKLRIFKTMLERLIAFLQVSKGNIVRAFKEKMASYEKQIIKFIDANRPRKAMSSMQLGQLAPPHMT